MRCGSHRPSAAVDTVVGSVTFDQKGDLKNASYDINRWSNGRYAPIAK